MNVDYGHQHYLDQLSSRKNIVSRALENIERRVAEVLYEKRKWFKWVRQCQDAEDTARESEKKKVKKEAALFRKHVQDIQARMQELRAKESLKQQEAYLEEAYHSRLSEEELEAKWDPIEDVIDDKRGNYIDLIKHILLLTESVEDTSTTHATEHSFQPNQEQSVAKVNGTKSGKKSKSKITTSGAATPLPDKHAHDTKSQVRQRLKEGVKLEYSTGWHVAGTIDNPAETHDKTAPVPDEEIDKLLEDMAEIKHLLFCRLLLSHATVLPAALAANSVDEFLNHEDVTDADLRDLAIKLDNPGLQEIRDACADLGRGEEEDDDVDDETEDDLELEKADDSMEDQLRKTNLSNQPRKHLKMPDKWAPTREKEIATSKKGRQSLVEHSGGMFGGAGKDPSRTMIDFGKLDDQRIFKSKKIRVRICGRYIYNYPSERAVNRDGWLQFCLIAKDSDLHDAINLCRHWDEFFDLNILSIFQYFPAARWLLWKGDRVRQQLLQMVFISLYPPLHSSCLAQGFIPYMQFEGAEDISTNLKMGSSRGQMRRVHHIVEARNWMCANIKRDDLATRRFLQYLNMQTTRVVVLVRDAKTSEILSSPPPDQLWLHREKGGIGRASKNEWVVHAEMGPAFFEKSIDSFTCSLALVLTFVQWRK